MPRDAAPLGPRPPTPNLALDLGRITSRYEGLKRHVPRAGIWYAVKANPSPPVLAHLQGLGGSFDIASLAELRACVEVGAAPAMCSFGNTAKREDDLRAARAMGVELFVFDSQSEVRKLARLAPGASVFCRLAVDTSRAAWPLGRKFGCSEEDALDFLTLAGELGLRPRGLSLHVGSQQRDPAVWDHAARLLARVLRSGQGRGLPLDLANLGGGMPADYGAPGDEPDRHIEALGLAVAQHLDDVPCLMLEPGRHLVAESGVLESTVLSIRSEAGDSATWIHLDAGRYNGLCEGDTLRFPITAWRGDTRLDGPTRKVILAGPTCDSDDVFGLRLDYHLPADVRVGDTLRFHSCGAYVSGNEIAGFNGVPQPTTYLVG